MKSKGLRLVLAAGAFAAAIGFASAGFAQGGPPPPAPPQDRATEMSQHLRDLLQLRPDQQPALDALIAAVAPPTDLEERIMRDMQEDRALPTPERLDHMLAHLDEVRSGLVARIEATKRFYAQLTPAQQRAFDALGPHVGHLIMPMGPRGFQGDDDDGPRMDREGPPRE